MLLKGRIATARKYRRHHGKSGARSAAGKCNLADRYAQNLRGDRRAILGLSLLQFSVSLSRSLSLFLLRPSAHPLIVPRSPPFARLSSTSWIRSACSPSTTRINTSWSDTTQRPRDKSGICLSVSDASARFELALARSVSESRDSRGYFPSPVRLRLRERHEDRRDRCFGVRDARRGIPSRSFFANGAHVRARARVYVLRDTVARERSQSLIPDSFSPRRTDRRASRMRRRFG